MRARKTSLTFDDLTVEGYSRAGEATWFRVHPPGLAFDAGRGDDALAGAADLFLTHGHLDHSLGVPYMLSRRRLQGLGTRIACPRQIAADLERLVEASASLEGTSYEWELLPLEPGDRVEVAAGLAVEAFAVEHVVPSLGYLLTRRRHRLAERFRGLPSERLAELRQAGEAIDEQWEEDWLAYCGDTGPATLDRQPRLFDCPVLLLECTFLGESTAPAARRYGHLHLEDLVERRDRFRNRAIVLHHLSRRFRSQELRAAIDQRLGALAERVQLLGG